MVKKMGIETKITLGLMVNLGIKSRIGLRFKLD